MAASKTFSRPIDPRYYWHQIRKRLWLVILIVFVSLTIGAYQVLSTQPLYRATARLLVNEKRVTANVVPFKDPLATGGRGGGFLRTQAKVLRSPALAEAVIQELGLEHHPEFVTKPDPLKNNVNRLVRAVTRYLVTLLTMVQDRVLAHDAISGTDADATALSQWVDGLKHWLQGVQNVAVEVGNPVEVAKPHRNLSPQAEVGVAGRDGADGTSAVPALPAGVGKPNPAFVARFLGRLRIRSEPDSEIINVSFRAYDANLTAEVANTLAERYIDFSRDMRFNAAEEAVNWLKEQAAEMQKKVEDSEHQLELYKEKHDVYSIEDRIAGITREITTLEAKIAEVRTERIDLDVFHRELEDAVEDPRLLDLFPVLGNSERMQEFKRAHEQFELELLQLRKRYGPGHPQVGKIRVQLRQQQQKIDDEVERSIAASEARYTLIQAREKSIKAQLDKLKDEVRKLNKIAIGYGTLERDAQSNRRLGDVMLTRLKEASLIPSLQGGNTARVIGPARVPKVPTNYQPTKSIMTAGLVGLILALGITAGLGYLNNTLETPQEAEEYLGLAVIGLIGQFKRPRKMEPDIDPGLFVLHAPRSQMAEAFKSLRTNMLFS